MGMKVKLAVLFDRQGKIYNIKANMKSYIQLETAAIFFLANLFIKQGIG